MSSFRHPAWTIGRRPGTIATIVSVAAIMAVTTPRATLAAPADGFDALDAHVRTAIEASALPGLAYAVVRDGEIVHLAAFGTADSTGRSMTVSTPIVIGSVGKTMTALAIRQLVESGRIDVAAPVQRYLPWFTLATPDAAAAITIGNLLDHTSGLSKADGQRPDRYRPGLTSEEVVRGLATVTPDRAAGTFEYSNLNYVVLGVVVEAVSGERYPDYLRDHIFAPLGMRHSYAAIEPARADGLAEGHRYLFGVPVSWDEPYPTAIVPAGYQVSTAEDMARYVAAFSNHGRYAGVDVVGGPAGERDYGIDWEPVAGIPEGYTPGHSGATLTSNTALVYMPVLHLGVVVLVNANATQLLNLPRGAFEIAFDVLRLELGVGTPTSGPTVREAYVVVDAVLLLLAALLASEVLRLRGWRRRVTRNRRRRLALVPSVLADGVLPLLVLVGLPLWVGSTGTTATGDVLGAWSFLTWTIPDLGLGLLVIGIGLLAVGGVKVALLRSGPGATAAETRAPLARA